MKLSVILLSLVVDLYGQQQQEQQQQKRMFTPIPAGIHYNNFFPLNVNFPVTEINELSGSVEWIPEGRTPQIFQRSFTNNRLFSLYSSWFNNLGGNSAGSSAGSSAGNTAIDIRKTSLATLTHTLTEYVVVSSLATIATEQVCLSRELFQGNGTVSGCGRKRRDNRRRLNIVASQVLPVIATAMPSVEDVNARRLPLLASKTGTPKPSVPPSISSSLQDRLMLKYERLTSTITTYSFSTTTILKALHIATDRGVLLCIPHGYVIC